MTKITTPAQLVENFLPEYEKRWAEALQKRPRCSTYRVRVDFVEKNFAEALAAILRDYRHAIYDSVQTELLEATEYREEDSRYILQTIQNEPFPEPKNK